MARRGPRLRRQSNGSPDQPDPDDRERIKEHGGIVGAVTVTAPYPGSDNGAAGSSSRFENDPWAVCPLPPSTVPVTSRRKEPPMLLLEGQAGPVPALAFSPDGEALASGGKGGAVRFWHPPADAGILKSPSDVVYSLAFLPDGHYLAFGGDDGQLHVWDIRERKPVVDSPKEKHAITAVTVVGSGTVLYGLGGRPDPVASPATLLLPDLPSARPRKFSFPVVNGIRRVVGLPARRVGAWATDTKILRLQDITRPPGKAYTLKNDCRALALSADGRRMAVTSDWDVLLFDVERAWP